jgi:maltooligosyltrehalose trehalohydrolase
MAVFLDVVYNHFGPDGAYATVFGPFCTEHHQTLWGQAINLDGEYSAGVRAFYIANARYWLREFHFDGLRLDATFALKDDSPHHFLAELNEAVQQLENWPRYLIAEDYRNLNHFVKPKRWGGYGLQAIWADDFHHLMERILTGINERYYIDYPASTAALAQTIAQGWYFTGQYSQYEKAIRGTDPAGILKTALVFCLQNHDQIGNRVLGDRLSRNTTLAAFRAASSLLLFLPELPLLFMGQEWAASSPFLYFTDHNPELGRLVTEGRQKEFKYQMAREEKIPDPQAPETFFSSKLKWEEAEKMPHRGIRKLYIDLLKFRRELSGDIQAVSPIDGGLVLQRGKYYLLVALSPHLKLLQPVNTRLVWHSESEDYVAEAMPPEMDLGQVHFVTPAAVLFMEEQ